MPREVKIGGVRLTLSMDAKQYASEIGKATSRARAHTQAVRQMRYAYRNLRRAFTGFITSATGVSGGLIGLTLAFRSIARGQREAATFGATLYEVAQAIGITVEQLQIMRRVFEADGVAISQTDKALARLARTAAESEYLETYARQFRELGIDMDEWRRQGGDVVELLFLMADGLQNMQSPAARVAAAMTLLGRGAERLVVPLQQGSEALRRNGDELAKIGLDSTETAFRLKILEQAYTDRANAIGIVNRKLRADNIALFFAWNQWITEITTSLNRNLIGAMKFLATHAETVRRVIAALISLLFAGRIIAFSTAIHTAAVAMRGFSVATALANVSLAGIRKTLLAIVAIGGVFFGLDAILKNLDVLTGTLDGANAEIAALEEKAKNAVNRAVGNIEDQLDGITDNVKIKELSIPVQVALQQTDVSPVVSLLREQREVERSLIRQANLYGLVGEERQKAVIREAVFSQIQDGQIARFDALEDAQKRLLQLRTLLRDVQVNGSKAEIEAVEKQIANAKVSEQLAAREYNNYLRSAQALQQVGTEIANQKIALQERGAALQEQQNRAGEVASAYHSLGNAVGQFAKSAILDFRNIDDSVKNLLESILNVVAELLVVRPIAQAIAGGLGATFGLEGFASGGRPPVGIPSLVGERGPELFVPDVAGMIVPNDRLGQRNQVVVNFAPVIQVQDRRAVDLALAEAYPAFEARIKGAVALDLARPSPLRRAAGT